MMFTPSWAVILDLDGTSLDTEAIDRRIWPAAAARLGFDLSDEFYRTLIGRSNADCEAAIEQHFGLAFPLPEFIHQRELLWAEQAEQRGVPVMTGLPELVSFLESASLPFAIATSSIQENAQLKLRAAGLQGRFQHVITADQVAAAKPAPDLYLEAARRLGLPPGRCIAVEDSDTGVFSAHAAGITVLMVPDQKTPSPAAAAAAYRILRTLHEVPDTVRLIMSSQQD